ncbi:hypothetical protein C1645_742832 [Glomus cerebriforme]|uniref:Uncharacterized protein n=1 Tax=Glomus cerebriforme TaxID=658196 RepID=A0A397SE06_9GLOM|nr:hypothetical protein C1645_742832 [Glomus cerebriforme]
MECTQDNDGKLTFRLSKLLFIAYENVGMKDMVKKILGHIIWLLEKVQKLVEVSQSDEQMRLSKKQRSSSNLAGKAKEVLNEEPIIKYHPPFLNRLKLDAVFQKYQIALEVQGAQHRFHSTSWYKDVKKLKNIVNRDQQKRCICLDNGISLLEV